MIANNHKPIINDHKRSPPPKGKIGGRYYTIPYLELLRRRIVGLFAANMAVLFFGDVVAFFFGGMILRAWA